MKKLVFSFLFAMISAAMIAQQGTITLEIAEVSSDDAQVAQFAEMMKGTLTEVHYKGELSVVKMNMMGGMVQTNLYTKESGEIDMLIDAMGQKMWVNMPTTDIAKQKAQAPEMEITYDKSDTKTIAGYECYKMNVVVDGDEEMEISGYITEELNIEAPVMQNVDMSQFAGFPLEYTVSGGPMNMTIVTKDFSDEVDDSVFEFKTGGYKKMTMDELQSLSGGAGFGF